MKRFDFEKLDVFQAALDFAALADEIAEALPPKRAYLADQLRRAASSAVLNIAEGAGEWSKSEKGRFYRYAKRSGTECAGVLALGEKLKLIALTTSGPAREVLWRLVCMLVRLVQSCRPSAKRALDRVVRESGLSA